MFIDYAYAELRSIVSAATGITPVWAPYRGPVTYPWCALEVVAGPSMQPDQTRMLRRESVAVTVSSGAPGDPVTCLISGRWLEVSYDTDETTTAAALADLAPSHWTAVAAGAIVTFTGPDVFGGLAYDGCTLVRTEIGDWLKTELVRCTAVVQVKFWSTEVRRWLDAPNGVDSCAIKTRNAIAHRLQSTEGSRVYLSARESVPQNWQGKDGIPYVGSVVRVDVTWVEFNVKDTNDMVSVDDVTIVTVP